jgi:hypothetical protein
MMASANLIRRDTCKLSIATPPTIMATSTSGVPNITADATETDEAKPHSPMVRWRRKLDSRATPPARVGRHRRNTNVVLTMPLARIALQPFSVQPKFSTGGKQAHRENTGPKPRLRIEAQFGKPLRPWWLSAASKRVFAPPIIWMVLIPCRNRGRGAWCRDRLYKPGRRGCG